MKTAPWSLWYSSALMHGPRQLLGQREMLGLLSFKVPGSRLNSHVLFETLTVHKLGMLHCTSVLCHVLLCEVHLNCLSLDLCCAKRAIILGRKVCGYQTYEAVRVTSKGTWPLEGCTGTF